MLKKHVKCSAWNTPSGIGSQLPFAGFDGSFVIAGLTSGSGANGSGGVMPHPMYGTWIIGLLPL